MRLLPLLLIFFCYCSKSDSDVKIYKTVVAEGLQMFTDVDSYKSEVILEIPYKSKVEIVDNKKYYIPDDKIVSSEYRKIKYKGKTGFVLSTYLSDRDDIPFVDKVKYDYSRNEFPYDKDRAIEFVKKTMIELGKKKTPLSDYYYIEDPQIFSFYGKDCCDKKVKIMMVIMISKIHKIKNCYSVFYDYDEKGYSLMRYGSQDFSGDKDYLNVKDFIERYKIRDDCDGE
jgi:hypothetical protein